MRPDVSGLGGCLVLGSDDGDRHADLDYLRCKLGLCNRAYAARHSCGPTLTATRALARIIPCHALPLAGALQVSSPNAIGGETEVVIQAPECSPDSTFRTTQR